MSHKCFFIYVGQSDMDYTLASQRDYSLKREPQIGFAYLSAILRQHDVESEILDFTIVPYTEKMLIDYVTKESPIFVGFYAAAALKNRLIKYIKFLRQKFPDLKILIGGPDMYDCESYLKAGADAFCIGEGEKTIIELAEYSKGKIKPEAIKGIAYRENGIIKYTSPRELIVNLDELPIPAWDKFDLNKYCDYHVFDMQQPYTSIMASRGCPFRCGYCVSHRIWANKYRRRSPDHVMREIDYLVLEQNVRYITFQDDIWAWMDDEWAKTICRELIARKYKLKWRCILHPFSFLKSRKEILPMMREAGCTSISTGLQSASKTILRNINRSPEEPEALAELVSIMKKAGILNNTAFIFGLPDETEETIEESIRYALKIRPTFCAFYVLSILPGSDMWFKQKQGPLHGFSDSFIKTKCQEAAKCFYADPRVMLNIFVSIIRTNPMWLLKIFGHSKYFLEISGILKNQSKKK